MQRNKINVKIIRNLIILIMAIIVVIGIYYNIKKSQAEEIITLMVKIIDQEELVETKEINIYATKNENGKYSIELPEKLENNKIKRYLVEDLIENDDTQSNNTEDEEAKGKKIDDEETRKIEVNKEKISNKELEIRARYDSKKTIIDDEPEGKYLYNKEIEYNNGEIKAEGYMPLNAKIEVNKQEDEEATGYEIRIVEEINDKEKEYEFEKYDEFSFKYILDGLYTYTMR